MKILKVVGGVLLVLLVFGGSAFVWQALRLEPDVELGSAAPDVSFATLDADPLALTSLRGQVVLLDFWGST
jgi:hypothetical protein